MVVSYFGNYNDFRTSITLRDKLEFLEIKHLAVEISKDQILPDHISRLTLSEHTLNQNQIRSLIQKKRRMYDLIIVEPTTASTAAFAARDGRVDYIRIYPKLGLHTFNKRYARRLVENNTMIEIDLSFFFGKYMTRYLRPLVRILKTFDTSKIPIWLTNLPEQPDQLRSYRGLQSLGRLIDLSNKSTAPRTVLQKVEKNRKKITGEIPFKGVEIDGS